MPAAFITATGTDIGKTYLTAGLARHLRQIGRKVGVLKPVVSGFDATAFAQSDPALLLEAIGETPSLATIEKISPWRFGAPLSPDMAARQSGGALDFAALLGFCRTAVAQAEDVLLIEGIGGLMVPLTPRETVLDWIAALDIEPIILAGTYVGSLSHTLTVLSVLQSRGLAPCALVLNETPGSAATLEETAASLQNFFQVAPILRLYHGASETNDSCFGRLVECVSLPGAPRR